MNKKHILIIEDVLTQAENIRNAIMQYLPDVCVVFPNDFGENQDLTAQDHLISQVVEGNHEKVLEYYDKIDIFIIDIYLFGHKKIGENLANFILSNKKGNYDIILISNNPLVSSILSDAKVSWLSKAKYDIDSYPDYLAQMVARIIMRDSKIETN